MIALMLSEAESKFLPLSFTTSNIITFCPSKRAKLSLSFGAKTIGSESTSRRYTNSSFSFLTTMSSISETELNSPSILIEVITPFVFVLPADIVTFLAAIARSTSENANFKEDNLWISKFTLTSFSSTPLIVTVDISSRSSNSSL